MKVSILYLLIGVLLGAAGQILLKKGMNSMGTVTLSLSQLATVLLQMVTNPSVFGGLVIYLGGTVFWLAALSRVELSYAYPFASLSYVIVLVASWIWFHENITVSRLVGTAVIGIGVLLVYRT